MWHNDQWKIGCGKVSRNHLVQIILAVAFATLLARLPFILNPGHSIDSDFHVRGFMAFEQLLAQGRLGQYLVLITGKSLGLDPWSFATMFQGVGILLFAIGVTLIFVTFAPPGPLPRVAVAFASLVVTLHPYSAEILTFAQASFTSLLGVAIGIGAVFLVARRPHWFLLGVVGLVMALSLYQLVLNYIAVLLVLGALQLLLRDHPAGALSPERYRPLLAPVLMVVAGLACYLTLYRLFLVVFGQAASDRGELLSLAQIGLRVGELRQLTAFLWDRPLLVVDAPMARLLIWGACIAGWTALLAWTVRRQPRKAPICALVLAALPWAGLGVVGIGSVWWPVPRVLGGVVVVWAAGIYWLFVSLRKPLPRRIAAAAVGLLLLGEAAIGHRIHSEQMLVNGFDRVLAVEIFRSLNQHPAYSSGVPVAIVNRNMRWAHALPLATTYYDMNMTAFAQMPSAAGVLEMTVGHTVVLIAPTHEHERVCDHLPAWPSAGFTSVTTSGEAVVCL